MNLGEAVFGSAPLPLRRLVALMKGAVGDKTLAADLGAYDKLNEIVKQAEPEPARKLSEPEQVRKFFKGRVAVDGS